MEPINQNQTNWKYIIIIVIISVITGSFLILVNLQEKNNQEIMIEEGVKIDYISSSWPVFESFKERLEETKNNTFLDIGTTVHYLQDIMIDTEKDIEEIEQTLVELFLAKKDLIELEKSGADPQLKILLDNYFVQTEDALNKLKNHQLFQKKMIDAYGPRLEEELISFIELYYGGGDRVNFIIQTEKVINLTEDAISKMEIITPPPDDQDYYAIRMEHLEGLKETFTRLNESYRTGDDLLALKEIEKITQRNIALNEKIKKFGKDYIANSETANAFLKITEVGKEIDDLYTFYQEEFNLAFFKKPTIKKMTEFNQEDYHLTVVKPNGGENLCLDDVFNISWEHKNLRFIKVYIRKAGGTMNYIGTFPADFNETGEKGKGIYPWKVGKTLVGTLTEDYIYEIVIWGFINDINKIEDNSDNLFSLIFCEG